VLVFDASVLIALFAAHLPVWDMWQRADSDELDIGIPATALAEANWHLRESSNAWAPLLWPPRVRVLPLSEQVALDTADLSGPLVVRHTLWEARHLGWYVVTRDRSLYPRGLVSIVVV
jgi:hypothetical protein